MNLIKLFNKKNLESFKNSFLTVDSLSIILLLVYILITLIVRPNCTILTKYLHNHVVLFLVFIGIIWFSQDNFILGVCLVLALLITINQNKVEKFALDTDSEDTNDNNDTDKENENEDDNNDSNDNNDNDNDNDVNDTEDNNTTGTDSTGTDSTNNSIQEQIKSLQSTIKSHEATINQHKSTIDNLNKQLADEKNKPFSEHAKNFFYENANKFMQTDIYKDKDHLFGEFINMFENSVNKNNSSPSTIEAFSGFGKF